MKKIKRAVAAITAGLLCMAGTPTLPAEIQRTILLNANAADEEAITTFEVVIDQRRFTMDELFWNDYEVPVYVRLSDNHPALSEFEFGFVVDSSCDFRVITDSEEARYLGGESLDFQVDYETDYYDHENITWVTWSGDEEESLGTELCLIMIKLPSYVQPGDMFDIRYRSRGVNAYNPTLASSHTWKNKNGTDYAEKDLVYGVDGRIWSEGEVMATTSAYVPETVTTETLRTETYPVEIYETTSYYVPETYVTTTAMTYTTTGMTTTSYYVPETETTEELRTETYPVEIYETTTAAMTYTTPETTTTATYMPVPVESEAATTIYYGETTTSTTTSTTTYTTTSYTTTSYYVPVETYETTTATYMPMPMESNGTTTTYYGETTTSTTSYTTTSYTTTSYTTTSYTTTSMIITTETTSLATETTTTEEPVETTTVTEITEEPAETTTTQATTEEPVETIVTETTEESVETTTAMETTEEPVTTTETTPEATEEPTEDLPETGTTGTLPARVAECSALALMIGGTVMILKSRKREN
ncbi:MAG: hypothetical protein K2J71_10415 [Oscillospiraceae bacterium]|nr:hypothetical protein [Oscillospiraceae bacterium]